LDSVPPIDRDWFDANALAVIEWVMELADLARAHKGMELGVRGTAEVLNEGGRSPQRSAALA
jgi:hypothetical protein